MSAQKIIELSQTFDGIWSIVSCLQFIHILLSVDVINEDIDVVEFIWDLFVLQVFDIV